MFNNFAFFFSLFSLVKKSAFLSFYPLQRATVTQLQHLLGRQGDPLDILERAPADPSAETRAWAEREPLLRTAELFLGARGLAAGGVPALVVSLSGGVDSMVLLHLLLQLQPRWRFRLHAAHVDYDNRPESSAEADYLRGWCAQHGVHCTVRVITEVLQGPWA